jgi:hypothetical protein
MGSDFCARFPIHPSHTNNGRIPPFEVQTLPPHVMDEVHTAAVDWPAATASTRKTPPPPSHRHIRRIPGFHPSHRCHAVCRRENSRTHPLHRYIGAFAPFYPLQGRYAVHRRIVVAGAPIGLHVGDQHSNYLPCGSFAYFAISYRVIRRTRMVVNGGYARRRVGVMNGH